MCALEWPQTLRPSAARLASLKPASAIAVVVRRSFAGSREYGWGHMENYMAQNPNFNKTISMCCARFASSVAMALADRQASESLESSINRRNAAPSPLSAKDHVLIRVVDDHHRDQETDAEHHEDQRQVV
jgi:hypothetical protein